MTTPEWPPVTRVWVVRYSATGERGRIQIPVEPPIAAWAEGRLVDVRCESTGKV